MLWHVIVLETSEKVELSADKVNDLPRVAQTVGRKATWTLII